VSSINVDNRSTRWSAAYSYSALPWWCVACPAVLFVILGAICHGPNTLDLDLDVSHWVQARNAFWADPLSTFGNTIGEAPVAVGVLTLSLIVIGLLKRWQDLWFVLVVAIGRLLSEFLKGWFESPRPTADQVRLHETFDNFGFPSGHTLTSTLVAGALVYLIVQQFRNPQIQAVLGLCWLLAIGCTAFARIWVGAHWLTDTLGGALFGIFIILLAANLSALLVKRWPGASPTAAP